MTHATVVQGRSTRSATERKKEASPSPHKERNSLPRSICVVGYHSGVPEKGGLDFQTAVCQSVNAYIAALSAPIVQMTRLTFGSQYMPVKTYMSIPITTKAIETTTAIRRKELNLFIL